MRTAIFAGFIGRDAELRSVSSGDSVAGFSLAVSTGTKDKPATLWVDCSLWGKRADGLAPYLLKGTPVTVCGDVDLSQYTTNAGQPGAKITCRVDKLTFGGKANGGNGDSQPAATPRPAPRPAPAPANAAVGYEIDDGIPFNRLGDFQH